MINIQKNLKLIEMEPKLYFLVMTSVMGEKLQLPNTFVHWGIYHSLEEAKATALQKMEETAPKGMSYRNFAWSSSAEIVLSAAQLEALFDEHNQKVSAEEKKKKNILMKQIIHGKDMGLLQRHLKRFNRSEIQYMKDRMFEKNK